MTASADTSGDYPAALFITSLGVTFQYGGLVFTWAATGAASATVASTSGVQTIDPNGGTHSLPPMTGPRFTFVSSTSVVAAAKLDGLSQVPWGKYNIELSCPAGISTPGANPTVTWGNSLGDTLSGQVVVTGSAAVALSGGSGSQQVSLPVSTPAAGVLWSGNLSVRYGLRATWEVDVNTKAPPP